MTTDIKSVPTTNWYQAAFATMQNKEAMVEDMQLLLVGYGLHNV